MVTVSINEINEISRIKPMHAVGQPPFLGCNFSYCKYLKEANIPYSRLHDIGGPYGGFRFVDIPNIFRDFSADETKEENYDFTFTDILVSSLMNFECEPIFRLGVTIENDHNIKAYRIFPPEDTEKWARICEHIVRHYNEGWASGFHYGIKYWEIWNEPDNGIDERTNMMWHGTKEDYYELYRVTSKHLRKCFGDSIKIGGYGSSGFYIAMLGDVGTIMASALGQFDGYTAEWEERRRYFVTFFEEFLDIVVKEKLPLDFFSHHSYASVENTLKMQKYVEDKLNEAGLTDTEIHLNEWNSNPRINERGTAKAASDATAMMIAMQKMKMDMMCYYDARIGQSVYGGLFNPITYTPFTTYYAFKAFGLLYKLGTEIESVSDSESVYVLAAKNGEKTGILISNTGSDANVHLGFSKALKAYVIDDENAFAESEINSSVFVIKEHQVIYFETI